nr:MAG TPA: hypothetical protein [Bacteriophage sp.]
MYMTSQMMQRFILPRNIWIRIIILLINISPGLLQIITPRSRLMK